MCLCSIITFYTECVCLLDYHVVHLQYSRMYIYISLFMYMLHVYIFFSRIKRGGCIASVCVCMFACLAVCRCIYVYIYREREFFFLSSSFFFPLPSHSNTRTFVRRRGTRASTLPPPKETMRSCACSYTQAPKFPPKIR